MGRKKHIDELQPATVDEHFELLLKDNSVIEEKHIDVTSHDLPEWYDEDLFKRGQEYIQTHDWSMGIVCLCGLLTILSVPEILKVLTYTQKTNTICAAFNRYIQTWFHIYTLHRADSTNSNSRWYKSLNVVRWRHCIATQRCLKNGLQGIRCRDMAITQFGFFGYALIKPVELGWSNKPEEREALNYTWRVISHMLGIPDRLNICRKTEAETTELCQKIADEIFAKNMMKYDKDFMQSGQIMLDAFWYTPLCVSSNVIYTITYNFLGLEYREPLSLYCQWELSLYQYLFSAFHLPVFGSILKAFLHHYVTILCWTLEHFPLFAILKFGRENVRVYLYPRTK